jgi:hypothetical protein
MSDLQCPARFILLTSLDGSAADALRHERLAAVYDAPPGATPTEPPTEPPTAAVTALAAALGVPVTALARPLALESVLARESLAVDALTELADVHRGETVLVLAEGRPGRRAEVAIDGDGVAVEEVSPGTAR